jgi:predicted ATPase
VRRRVRLPPESDYRFKHALIQDAAYENLLKSRRQTLHRRIAEALRGDLPSAGRGWPSPSGDAAKRRGDVSI